ncbi:MAG: hypothetical protein H8F28_25960 [Fibrella sp.]|nr:hypothetical protein [Armatimonadota bacterium]
MRSTHVILFSLVTMLLSPGTIHLAVAQDTLPSISPTTEDPKAATLRKQIQGYYNEMDKATERLDMDGGFKYIAPDCKVILRDGMKVNVKTLKETSSMIYRRSIKTQIKTEITQFMMKGETATVETRSTSLMRLRGDNGIESDLDAVGQSRDFWMKTKGGWRIKQSRETDRTLKINGQIIQE